MKKRLFTLEFFMVPLTILGLLTSLAPNTDTPFGDNFVSEISKYNNIETWGSGLNRLNVSESSNQFIVENLYYRAKLSKSAIGVSEFYIKPEITKNIVSTSVDYLGGHELISYNPTIPKNEAVAQWFPSEADAVSLTKVVETADFVTFRGFMDWGSKSVALPFNIVEYVTFYANKPYYLVTYTRTYEEDYAQIGDDQTCFFLNPSTFWYDSNLADGGTWHSVNATGHVVQGTRYKMYLHESTIYGKYPFVWVYNTTMDVGYGTILLDAYPRSYSVSLGSWYGGTEAIGYTEYQISQSVAASGARAGESITVTYLGVVDDSTDYSYISNLSSALFSGNAEIMSGIFKPLVSMSAKADGISTFGSDSEECSLRSYSSEFGLNGYYCAGTYTPMQFYLVNATRSYAVWNWTSVSITDHKQNDTYAMVQWEESRYELNWTVKWEIYRNSDTIKGFFDVEAMSNHSITDLYLRHRVGAAAGIVWKSTSDPSYVKVNATDNYNPSLKDNGWMVKNMTNTARTATGTYYLDWYLLNNSSPQEYPAETHWNITLHFQYFKRYDYEGLDYFVPSDFKDPTEGNSQIMRFNKRYWANFPLFGQKYGMRTASYSHTKSQLAYSKFSDDGKTLTLTIVGDPGTTSTTKIYVGDKDEPVAVYATNGTLTWSYDASTTILTLNVTHESHTRILIYWKFLGDVDDDGDVDGFDLTRMCGAYGSTPGHPRWDEDCDINLDDIVDGFDLTPAFGNYGNTRSKARVTVSFSCLFSFRVFQKDD